MEQRLLQVSRRWHQHVVEAPLHQLSKYLPEHQSGQSAPVEVVSWLQRVNLCGKDSQPAAPVEEVSWQQREEPLAESGAVALKNATEKKKMLNCCDFPPVEAPLGVLVAASCSDFLLVVVPLEVSVAASCSVVP